MQINKTGYHWNVTLSLIKVWNSWYYRFRFLHYAFLCSQKIICQNSVKCPSCKGSELLRCLVSFSVGGCDVMISAKERIMDAK